MPFRFSKRQFTAIALMLVIIVELMALRNFDSLTETRPAAPDSAWRSAQIIKARHGRIWATSNSRGSTFHVLIPASPIAAPAGT